MLEVISRTCAMCGEKFRSITKAANKNPPATYCDTCKWKVLRKNGWNPDRKDRNVDERGKGKAHPR